MSTISSSKNQPGENITVINPNQTIQNLKGIEQNFSSDNLKLQGLEKRNFEPSSITGNMPSTNIKNFPDRTSQPNETPLGWFQNAFFYIGPIYRDPAKKETLLIEMSAGFETSNTNNGSWAGNDN
jgi:hypothetical protein